MHSTLLDIDTLFPYHHGYYSTHLETKFTHFITINVFSILFNSYFHSLFYIFYNQLAGISYTFNSQNYFVIILL